MMYEKCLIIIIFGFQIRESMFYNNKLTNKLLMEYKDERLI